MYSVEDASTGQPYAMKRMLCQDAESRSIAETEIRMLRALKGHPNIIQYVASCSRKSTQSSQPAVEYFILMELCTGGSLIDLIKRRDGRKLPEIKVAELFQQICSGIAHMHAQTPPIAHRDLKIENVLLTKRGAALCDFGSCTTRSQAYTTQREIVEEEERISKYSTQMYRSPELCSLSSNIGKPAVINEKVDIWSLGATLYTIAFFTQPFQDGGNLQIISGSYQLPDHQPYSNYLTALIKRLLTVDPEKRPNITQVMNLCEQWQAFLKNGGKKRPSPSPASAVATPPAPTPSPPAARSSPSTTAADAQAAKDAARAARKASKRAAKHVLKHAESAPPSSTAAAGFDADWADFSNAPPVAKPAAPTKVRGPPPPQSSSDDSSTDEEAPPARNVARGAPPARPTVSRAQSQPAQQAPPPPLLDFFSFDEAVATPSKPPVTAAASAFHADDDGWASFDSVAPATTFAAPVTVATNQRAAPAAAAATAVDTSLAFDFDFSGISTTKTTTASKPAAAAASTTPSARKSKRHTQDRDSDTIDLSKLHIGGGRTQDDPQRLGRITIGKTR